MTAAGSRCKLWECQAECPSVRYRRRYQGHVGAALVLGGYDLNGPHLFTVGTAVEHRVQGRLWRRRYMCSTYVARV